MEDGLGVGKTPGLRVRLAGTGSARREGRDLDVKSRRRFYTWAGPKEDNGESWKQTSSTALPSPPPTHTLHIHLQSPMHTPDLVQVQCPPPASNEGFH